MKQITTDDGSITFRNEEFDEIYHTKSGAVEEAFVKFVGPTHIEKLAKTGSINILDVCFGLGYNSCAALDRILELNPKCIVNIVGLESDKVILDKISGIKPPLREYNRIKQLVKNYHYDEENIHMKLLIGDARNTIKQLTGRFDAVFLDPFSPKKQPDLWQTAFLRDIREKMNEGAFLATYSCARIVRDNLKDAGFLVSDGPISGRRSPATVAENP